MENRIYEDCFADWNDTLMQHSDGYETLDAEFKNMGEPTFVFSVYEQGGYEGDCFVIYSYDGVEFFMTSGSHCSCFGLEGQWSPDETTYEALRHIFTEGSTYGVQESYKDRVLAWLEHVAVNAAPEEKISVYDEWMGHVADLKRIASQIAKRPTMDSGDQIDVLEAMASAIAADADNYEAERKQDQGET